MRTHRTTCYVVNGRSTPSDDARLAFVRMSPVFEYVIETDDGTTATCRVKRKGEPEQSRTFSIDDAMAAGLRDKPGPWMQDPKRMRKMRARDYALSDVFSDVLCGKVQIESSSGQTSAILCNDTQSTRKEIEVKMQTHQLIQGSHEWHTHRAQHFNASDAASMMGCSPYKSRTDLLKELATGIKPEINQATQRRFDEGHRCEALALPLAEAEIGEELYPVTGCKGRLSASFDGLTMMETVAWEHKTMNDQLRAAMVDGCTGGDLPLHYQVQMEQQCIVSGAERVLFSATQWSADGELIEDRHCWYTTNTELAEKIRAGWEYFAADLAAYVPTVDEPKTVGRSPDNLPALRIEVQGAVTASNLIQFRAHALDVFKGINRKLISDQDFADADKTVKWCEDVEKRLEAAKAHALSQTATIDELFSTIDSIKAEARATRLELEKLVKSRKDSIKLELITEAKNKLMSHIDELNIDLGYKFISYINADFAGAIRGKRSIDSSRDALAMTVLDSMELATKNAKRIKENISIITTLASNHRFLFPDSTDLMIDKAPEDLTSLIKMRINEHTEAEARRLAEFNAKQQAEELAAKQVQLPLQNETPLANLARSLTGEGLVPPSPDNGQYSLRLGTINARLGLQVSTQLLLELGYKAKSEGAARLYRNTDWPGICAALARHITAAASMPVTQDT